MKTGWKLATLVLAVVLSPRVATADAVLVPGAGPAPHTVAAGVDSLSPRPAASLGSSAPLERVPGHARGAQMTVVRQRNDGASIGMPTKRAWGIPRRWKLTTRSQVGGSEAIRPHPRGLGGPRATERPVALLASGVESAPTAEQQLLEGFGGKRPAEQEPLSETASQGP